MTLASKVEDELGHTPVPASATCPTPCTAEFLVLPKTHRSASAVNGVVDLALTYNPNPKKAAQLVAFIFANSRARRIGHSWYPLGAKISYNLKLDGFANSQVTLKWSLLANGQSLPRSWWKDQIAQQIRPDLSGETLPGEFWVPLPSKPGDYEVELVLTDNKGIGATSDSAPPLH